FHAEYHTARLLLCCYSLASQGLTAARCKRGRWKRGGHSPVPGANAEYSSRRGCKKAALLVLPNTLTKNDGVHRSIHGWSPYNVRSTVTHAQQQMPEVYCTYSRDYSCSGKAAN